MTSRVLQVFRGAERRPANDIGQVHVAFDELDQQFVAAKAKQLRMEDVVGLMNALEIPSVDRSLIAVIDGSQPLQGSRLGGKPDAQRRLTLQDLPDIVDFANLVGAETTDRNAAVALLDDDADAFEAGEPLADVMA